MCLVSDRIPECPLSPPTAGSACDQQALSCTYMNPMRSCSCYSEQWICGDVEF